MCLQLARIFWGHFASCLIYDFAFQVFSERTLCGKDFISNNNCNFNSYRFSYKLAFITSFFFLFLFIQYIDSTKYLYASLKIFVLFVNPKYISRLFKIFWKNETYEILHLWTSFLHPILIFFTETYNILAISSHVF